MQRWVRASLGWCVAIFVLSTMIVSFAWNTPAVVEAQSGETMVFPSGHWIDDTYGFLTYWQEHQGEMLLGPPITAPFDENGLVVQYFENGRLELHSELEGSPVLPGRVGSDYAAALWLSFNFKPSSLKKSESGNSFFAENPETPTSGERLFEETGYTLQEPFLGFWEAHDGINSFGFPISQPLWEYIDNQLLMVQYFERGRLERHTVGEGLYEVRISSLGRNLAVIRGYDTTPTDPGTDRVVLWEQQQAEGTGAVSQPVAEPMPEPTPTPLPTPTPVPAPAPAPAPAAGKYIVVNLTTQWLYAFEGDVQVFDAPVSTGRDGLNTPTGTFSIYAKVPLQTMSGTIAGEYYSVPNVPHAMYIYGGVAMHGTYWHNQFGTGARLSHGCINLPLDAAEWLYNWAPVGTTVYVRY